MHACSSAVSCIERIGWSKDLTQAKMNTLIKTIVGMTYGSVFIFAPKCGAQRGRFFSSGNGLHTEEKLLNACAGNVVHFFLSSAPCPTCAMKLMGAYGSSQQKPIIYIARPYQGNGVSGKGGIIVNTMCLAMLSRAGFKIRPWDWELFHNYLTDDQCKNAIINNYSQLQWRVDKMTEYLHVVQTMINGCTTDFIKECKKAAVIA